MKSVRVLAVAFALLTVPHLTAPAQAAEVISQNQVQVTLLESDAPLLNPVLREALLAAWPDYVFRPLAASDASDQSSLSLLAQPDAPPLLLVPRWSWGPVELSGPHYRSGETETDASWAMRAEARLKLTLEVYRKTVTGPERLGEINDSWPLGKDIVINRIDELLAIVNQATGVTVDLQNPNHQKLVLDVVRQVPSFKKLEETPAPEYLAEELPALLSPDYFKALTSALQQQGWLQAAPPPDKTVSPKPETSTRATSNDRLGLNVVLRGGTAPLWLNGQFSQTFGPDPAAYFTPQFQLDLEYEIGRLFNFPGFYLSLGGGSSTPIQQSLMDQGGGGQFQPMPSPSALAIVGELGLGYLWNLHPFQIHFGLRGGMLYGLLMEPFPTQPGMTSTMSFGGGALVGGRWNITPNFFLGLDLGGRFYSPGFWANSGFGFPQPVQFPPLTSFGPLIQVSAGLAF
ncbi:MAG: hypothetical protein IGS03_16175 [Candidatus Sericytochromatia bacterium]|nr:hypothetical protein [Candidatus Sericytochromatia bacterium]